MKQLGKNFLILAGTTLLLWGCAVRKPSAPTAVTATETVPVMVASPTLPAALTLTPSATPLPIPSLEPFLKTNGPYLAYFLGSEKAQQLVLMDADGTGKKVISVPSEHPVELSFLSPDGKWLAYYLGSADKDHASDLSLHLLNLESDESRLVAKLLSSDYPNNFAQAAKEINDPSINEGMLKWTFLGGITRSVAWSPDGQFLAFGGQMDGPSSDIYLYDMTTGVIRRVTRGPEQIQGIEWSPDGKSLLSSSETVLAAGGAYTEDAIALPGLTMKSLPTRGYGVHRSWYNNHAYIVHNNQNVAGDNNLQSVNLETGKITPIWDGSFYHFVFDPENELLVIFPITRTWPPKADSSMDQVFGTYLLNIAKGSEIELQHAQPNTVWFGLGDRRFFTKDEDKTFFILSDGTSVPTNADFDNVSVAPDKQHWVSIAKTLKVFRADDTLVFEMALPFPPTPSVSFFNQDRLSTLWTPDSSGLFIILDQQIYRLDLHHKEIRLVETGFTAYQDLIFTAVGKK